MKKFLLLIILVIVFATACGEPPEPTINNNDNFVEIETREIEVREITIK